MIKLIAFDWNGTLLADTSVAWKADNAALVHFGFKPISLTRFRQAFDMPIVNYWKNVGLSEKFLNKNLKKLEQIFIESYGPRQNSSRSRAGSRQILSWIQKQKIISVIYTNAPTSTAESQLKRLKLNHLVKASLGRSPDDFSHLLSRGKQTRLEKFVKEHKLKPHEVISVGDSEEEVQIGKVLGYHTVAITGGYNTTARLKKHKPDFLIHNMLELKKIINKLNA